MNFYCYRVKHQNYVKNYGQLLFSNKLKNNHYQLRSDSRILIFVDSHYSRLSRQLIEVLESLRFKYKVELLGKNLPPLINQNRGKFSVIIFENLLKYFKMTINNKKLLDDYCRQFNVGIIGFTPKLELPNNDNHKIMQNAARNNHFIKKYLNNYPVNIINGYRLKDYQLNPLSKIFHIARAGTISLGNLMDNDWFVFEILSNTTSFVPIAQALTSDFQVETYPGGYPVNFQNNSVDYYSNYRAHLLTTVLLVSFNFKKFRR